MAPEPQFFQPYTKLMYIDRQTDEQVLIWVATSIEAKLFNLFLLSLSLFSPTHILLRLSAVNWWDLHRWHRYEWKGKVGYPDSSRKKSGCCCIWLAPQKGLCGRRKGSKASNQSFKFERILRSGDWVVWVSRGGMTKVSWFIWCFWKDWRVFYLGKAK